MSLLCGCVDIEKVSHSHQKHRLWKVSNLFCLQCIIMSGTQTLIQSIFTLLHEMGISDRYLSDPSMKYYLMIIFAMVMFPFFLRNIRISQARNLLKRSNVVFHEERKMMEQQAIEKVKDISHALLGLADQAIQMHRHELALEILTLLRENSVHYKKHKREIQRLQRVLRPKPSQNLLEEIVLIERFVENELWALAQEHTTKAKEQWPNAQELDVLQSLISSRQPPM